MIVAELFAKLGLIPDKKQWAKGNELITGMHKKLIGFAAGLLSINFFGGMVKDVADLSGHVNDLAQKLTIGREELQQYGYAAQQSGSSLDAFAGGMQKLALNLDTVASGKGPVVDALRSLGIATNDPLVKTKNLDGLFMKITARMEKIPNVVDKTTLAVKLFGQSGAGLVPLLNNGAQGIADLRKEAERIGAVLNEEAIEGMAAFGDSTSKVKAQLLGLRNQAVAALLPVLQRMVNGLLAWIEANREVLQSMLESVVSALAVAFDVLGIAVNAVVQVFAWLSEHGGVAKAILISLGVVIGLVAAKAVAAFALAAAAFAVPIAIITALVMIFKDLYKSLKTGKGHFADAARWIISKFTAVGRFFKNIVLTITNAFRNAADAIRQAWSDLWDWLEAKATEFANNKVVRAMLALGGMNGLNQVTDAVNQRNAAPAAPTVDVSRVRPFREFSSTTNNAKAAITIQAPITIKVDKQPPASALTSPEFESNFTKALQNAHAQTRGGK